MKTKTNEGTLSFVINKFTMTWWHIREIDNLYQLFHLPNKCIYNSILYILVLSTKVCHELCMHYVIINKTEGE